MNYVTLLIPVFSRRQVVVGGLGVLALLAAYAMWLSGDLSPEVETVDVKMTGSIYYSADPDLESGYIPAVYRHSFDAGVESGMIADGAHAYDGLQIDYDVMVMHQSDTVDPDAYQPVWRHRMTGEVGVLPHVNGYRETDLAASPQETHYAYSFQTEADADIFAIEDWSIAVHAYPAGTYIVLNEAIEPTWTYNGNALIYMKRDGLYLYDLESSTSVKLIEKYQNLSTSDDITVTKDGTFLVLTLPSLNRIAVFEELVNEYDQLEYVELPGVSDVSARFRHPVLHPDGEHFAVVRVSEADFDESRETYTAAIVEIRETKTGRLTETVVIKDVDPNTLRLEAWRR